MAFTSTTRTPTRRTTSTSPGRQLRSALQSLASSAGDGTGGPDGRTLAQRGYGGLGSTLGLTAPPTGPGVIAPTTPTTGSNVVGGLGAGVPTSGPGTGANGAANVAMATGAPVATSVGPGATSTSPLTSTPGAYGASNTTGAPWTGFAQRYAPINADMLLSNPSQIFYDAVRANGLESGGQPGGYTKQLEPYADIIQSIYAILNNGNSAAMNDPNSAINFAANFADQMTQVGGNGLDPNLLLSHILNDPAMQTLYRTGNPTQNASQLNDMREMVAGLSFNPMWASIVKAQDDANAYQYLSQWSQGKQPGNYDQWVAQNGGF